MASVIVTMGPPGCGKNTWATERAKKSKSGCTVINRDDLRGMMVGGDLRNYKFNDKIEKMVTDAQMFTAKQAIALGRDVIVADTNLNPNIAGKWRQLAKDEGCNFEVYNFFEVYRKENAHREVDIGIKGIINNFRKLCKARNLLRLNSVPEDVIDLMINKYIVPMYYKPVAYTGTPGMPKAVLLDLDGTLCHMTNRGPFDWARVGEDTLDPHVYETVCLYHAAGYKILAVSGRDAICKNETTSYLNTKGVPYEKLFMRPQGDQRPDNVVKEEIFWQQIAKNYDVRLALDDRNQVCEQYREMGIKVYQVNPGDF